MPNNGIPSPADHYDVAIGATGSPFTITVDRSISIDRLTFDSPDALLRITQPFQALDTMDVRQGTVRMESGAIRSATIVVSDGASVQAAMGTLDDVTISGDVVIDVHGRVEVQNGLHLNQGIISLRNDGTSLGTTELLFAGDQTLTGQGTMDLSTGRNNWVAASSGTLTIGPEIIVMLASWDARLGDAATGLINQGTVRAVGTGGQTIAGANWINQGLFEVFDTATLYLDGSTRSDQIGSIVSRGGRVVWSATIDNRDMAWDIQATLGRLDVFNARIIGGRLVGSDLSPTPIYNNSSVRFVLQDVTFDTDVFFAYVNPTRVEGALTVNRQITFISGGGLGFANGGRLDGTGEIIVNSRPNSAGYRSTFGGDGFVIGPDVTFRMGVDAGGSQAIVLTGDNWVNPGSVRDRYGRAISRRTLRAKRWTNPANRGSCPS